MKVLHVYSPFADYGAAIFEENFKPEEVAKDMKVGEKKTLWEKPTGYDGEFEPQEIECILLEFGEVDPAFMKFVRDEIQDYDDSKHHNFYVLSE